MNDGTEKIIRRCLKTESGSAVKKAKCDNQVSKEDNSDGTI